MVVEINIDDGLARRLQRAAKAAHISLNQVVQRALHTGVQALPIDVDSSLFVTQPHDFGVSLANPKAALAALEEEDDLEHYRRGGG